MQRDLTSTIESIAKALGIDVTVQLLQQIADAVSFEAMKSKADQFAPEAGTGMWKQENRFFATGKNEQWKDKLTVQDLAKFDARINDLLTPEQAEWIVNGGSVP